MMYIWHSYSYVLWLYSLTKKRITLNHAQYKLFALKRNLIHTSPVLGLKAIIWDLLAAYPTPPSMSKVKNKASDIPGIFLTIFFSSSFKFLMLSFLYLKPDQNKKNHWNLSLCTMAENTSFNIIILVYSNHFKYA